MSARPADFAIFGSNPAALFLAGLLAGVHGQSVCLVGEFNSAFRLARGADLSVAAMTRPEVWSLLRATTPEATKLLGRAGLGSAMSRIDPVFVAQTEAGRAALSHIRHMALGFGYDVDRLPDNAVLAPSSAVRWRDAVTLSRPQAEIALESWAAKSGVRRLLARETRLEGAGPFTLEAGADRIPAARVILADESAILTRLDPALRDPLFVPVTATSVLTEPAAPLLAPFIAVIDRDLTYAQRPNRGVAALAMGRTDHALVRIGNHLAGNGALRRAGQSVFRTVIARDGAPVIGTEPVSGMTILGALGLPAVFLVPALARYLAGKAGPEEGRFFASRAPGPAEVRAAIAELPAAAVGAFA